MANENQTTFTCSGDCLKCSEHQRIYCAAQMSRTMIDMVVEIRQRVERMEKASCPQTELVNPMSAPSDALEEDVQPTEGMDV